MYTKLCYYIHLLWWCFICLIRERLNFSQTLKFAVIRKQRIIGKTALIRKGMKCTLSFLAFAFFPWKFIQLIFLSISHPSKSPRIAPLLKNLAFDDPISLLPRKHAHSITTTTTTIVRTTTSIDGRLVVIHLFADGTIYLAYEQRYYSMSSFFQLNTI